jgi:hypothetical protein
MRAIPELFMKGAAAGRTGSTVLFALVTACALACGPVGPFSGGALRGPVGDPVVSDWSFAATVETAQLETRPDDPHSVNTWFATIDDRLYVPTSMILGPKQPSQRSWVTRVEADPRVRIRLGQTVYERIARRVEDPSDPERVIWIYRLDPRSS